MKLSQTELEELVFKKFLKHTDLNVIRFKSCKPPKPDILCEHQCGKLYFELTDNTSEEIQKSIHAKNEQIRKKAYWFSPFPEHYRQKFRKKYDTNSLSCELIIYFGNHPVAELGPHFDNRLQENLEWIRQNINQSEFQKVWIYDYHKDMILDCVDGCT
ncbi:MAG: hypothetical protein SRB2_04851 [Desulfobacteraceae bacterium Eth-SRB2]|nr:MAG: hypothetical protein SRB2_04851 [Desulfobacteraceae bacterium Eth-SRB2]